MENNGNNIRLSGGTLFILLTKAMKSHGRSGRSYGKKSDGINEANMLKDLVRIYCPSYDNFSASTMSSNASNFKKGADYSEQFCFNEDLVRKKFDTAIKEDYNSKLKLMDDFVEKYIDTFIYSDWLVNSILELIFKDGSIPEDALFYISDEPVRNKDIWKQDQYILPGCILGAWHYFIMNVRDNSVGKDTFLLWYPDGLNGEFKSAIGKLPFKNINIVNRALIFGEDIINVEEDKSELLSDRYAAYIKEAKKTYSKVKTILHDEPKSFKKTYVCNGVSRYKGAKPHNLYAVNKEKEYIKIPTVDSLKTFYNHNHFIVEGTGGLGKSMMMQHLMLDTLEHCDKYGMIPIYVMLKDYTGEDKDIASFVFSQFKGRFPSVDLDNFNRDLKDGKYALLFDGFDEINPLYLNLFMTNMDIFADAFSENMMIISSRPFSDFTNMKSFTVLHLMPFDLEKAVELISKLEFRKDDPSFKTNFLNALPSLYFSHGPFVENPLLLTFMLMTSERSGPVSNKMHEFYSDVYDLLAKRHDNSKSGYNRTMKSGLSPEQLKRVFAVFCANTYQENELSFTEEKLIERFEEVIPFLGEDHKNVKAEDLISDFSNAICLLYRDGNKYVFLHRSFQEYFCAYSFSRQLEDQYPAIGEFFEKRMESINRRISEKTFSMLCEMVPEKVEKCIYIPFLEELFRICDSRNGYITYLTRMRPSIYYEQGDVDMHMMGRPNSFLYDHIITRYGTIQNLYKIGDSLPRYENYVRYRYIIEKEILDDGEEQEVLVEVSMFDEDSYKPEDFVGWSLCVDVSEIYDEPETYGELIDAMEKDDFPYMIEYKSARKLLADLKEKYKSKQKLIVSVL